MLTSVQATIESLSAQLEEAYTHRAQLWIDFEKALDEFGDAFLRFSLMFACLILITIRLDLKSSQLWNH